MSRPRNKKRSTAVLMLLTTFALAVGGSAATAATEPLATSTPTIGCSDVLERPFLPWLDPNLYVLAPGGDFEGRSGWALSGGSKIVAGNEPFNVGGTGDRQSLAIPPGGSATSPSMCVSAGHPTLRLFAKGGGLSSPLKVEVIYRTFLGVVSQPVADLPTQRAWAPTLPMLFLANATGLLALDGLTSSVQFRFTATGSAGWQIDDVYVDPWKVT